MSGNLGSEHLSLIDRKNTQMEPSTKGQTAMSAKLGLQQLPSTNKQSAQVDSLPRFHAAMPANFGLQQLSSTEKQSAQSRVQAPMSVLGSYQLLSANKKPVQMEPSPKAQTSMPFYLGSQRSPLTNIRPSKTEPSLKLQAPTPVSLMSQSSSSSNKRPIQTEAPSKVRTAMSISLGLQQLSSTNKRPAQMEPSPKVQTESFESVRLKLRETLAASLALDSLTQSKPQVVEKSAPSEVAGTSRHTELSTQPNISSSMATNAALYEGSSTTLTSNKHVVQKYDEGKSLSSDKSTNDNTNDSTKLWKCDVQEFQPKHASSEHEVSVSNDFTDELLQGNGLCWASDYDTESTEAKVNRDPKRPKLVHGEVNGDKEPTPALQNPETLALKIEAELFRLFGGVNKKYKEKARSLLFNLKDRNNPELRERVLSGDLAPERLCSMTAEELASKELSEWRLAKAEEFAQMVVLPDSDVDIRRLVRKTHKGEFQVEVERDDSVSAEVTVGTSLLSQIPSKAYEIEVHTKSKSNDKEVHVPSKPYETEALPLDEKVDSGDQNLSSNLANLPHEKTDLMQELMVDELKDAEFLPPIVSLDEFMEALDSEPPFENLSVDNVSDMPISGQRNSDSLESEMTTTSDSLGPKLVPASDRLESKLESSQNSLGSNLDPSDMGSEDPVDTATNNPGKMDVKYTRTDSKLKSDSAHIESDTCSPDVASNCEHVWEGLIQLNVSALVTVIGLFRSGEKTSTEDWPNFLEIKGRVRLDAFEKFLQELPQSRSRAIMVVQFCWKAGSPERGRLNLCETVDSYITDERVGFAEPAPGVELYFCPPHSKTTEILGRNLPKEHTETLNSTVNGLIGVVVWRKAHVTISPRLSSHHKHSNTKKQFSSRKQQNIISNSTSRSLPPLPVGAPPTNPEPPYEEELIDDVPPGFGPAAARDEDDLPEFDFVQGSSAPNPPQSSGPIPHIPPPARPADQMRALIHKYGQSEAVKNPSINIEPWNDDDDIPEWQPNQDNHPQPQPQPPPLSLPPPPPLPQLHGFQQQNLQPFFINQQNLQPFISQQPLQHPHAPPQPLVQLATPLPMPFQPMQPQMRPMQGPPHNLHPSWKPAPWWGPANGPAEMGVPMNGLLQPCHYGGVPSEVQPYGMPTFVPSQNRMDWRPDIPRNRGA